MIISTESPNFEEIKEYFEHFVSEFDSETYAESDEHDMHEYAFNTDYYIIGTHKAKEWCGADTWEIIQTVVDYEKDNFGEVSTPIDDPERVVNMYTYIVGEQVVYDYFEEGEKK
tara:strand:+ start:1208 stop:1549 length:342 start_codon:yes stop_codon:yes gene_type:complete